MTAIYSVMKVVAEKRSESYTINDDNPYIHMYCSLHSSDTFPLNSNMDLERRKAVIQPNIANRGSKRIDSNVGIYEGKIKPSLDKMLSFVGLILLSPLFGAIAIAIKLDDPGPVFFTQKRIGKDKTYFMCHKFRSMKTSAPHDIPTHQLSDPGQYITKVGRVLRKASLDELPQIWDVFRGKMSLIGPRPALWNQDDLVALRCGSNYDRIDANSVIPGLTGLAQIKGRDKLELKVKAQYDREYTEALRKGGISALGMDIKCFFGTIGSVMRHEGVVEGGIWGGWED